MAHHSMRRLSLLFPSPHLEQVFPRCPFRGASSAVPLPRCLLGVPIKTVVGGGQCASLRPKMCGVVGIYGHAEAANLAYLGLHALQHRGQESAGIVSTDGEKLRWVREVGHGRE